MSINEFHAALNGDTVSEFSTVTKFSDRESFLMAGGDGLGDWEPWS